MMTKHKNEIPNIAIKIGHHLFIPFDCCETDTQMSLPKAIFRATVDYFRLLCVSSQQLDTVKMSLQRLQSACLRTETFHAFDPEFLRSVDKCGDTTANIFLVLG